MESDLANNSLKIASNLDFINSNMSLIQKIITNPNYSSKKLFIDFKCSGDVYDSINKCLNLYFYGTDNLLDKLLNETKNIIAMGESIQKLDNELNMDTGDL